MKTVLLLIILVSAIVRSDKFADDDAGYLYEKPDKGLLTPTEEETEIPIVVTEKEHGDHSTETGAREEIPHEETHIESTPEVTLPEGYLPPEEEPFDLGEKGNFEIGSAETFLNARKRQFQIVKRKINAVKEKEKNRAREMLGLPPHHGLKAPTSKEMKHAYRN